uniref:Secreted protein n=1 Tax=Oryza glumipatula TaxID=40148 RepID=A0A0D9Y8L2_9ORYZ
MVALAILSVLVSDLTASSVTVLVALSMRRTSLVMADVILLLSFPPTPVQVVAKVVIISGQWDVPKVPVWTLTRVLARDLGSIDVPIDMHLFSLCRKTRGSLSCWSSCCRKGTVEVGYRVDRILPTSDVLKGYRTGSKGLSLNSDSIAVRCCAGVWTGFVALR